MSGETAAQVADDATAAQVETALEALNVVDEVTVTGSASSRSVKFEKTPV